MQKASKKATKAWVIMQSAEEITKLWLKNDQATDNSPSDYFCVAKIRNVDYNEITQQNTSAEIGHKTTTPLLNSSRTDKTSILKKNFFQRTSEKP